METGFNIRQQARELGISIWKTPTILFFLLGCSVVFLMFLVYFVARRSDNVSFLILAESGVAMVTLFFGGTIIRTFEQVTRFNKLKADFISAASHQMKTPLSRIKWQTELWREKYKGKRASVYCADLLRTVESSNEQLIRTVNRLIDVDKLGEGRTIVVREPTDIVASVKKISREYASLAKEKNIRLFLHINKVPLVYADRRSMETVIENFLSNAIKYTPEGGDVSVQLGKKKEHVIFSVSDEGIGVPEPDRKHIFDKFHRAKNSEEIEGTGLGLYLVKKIMEQLEGFVEYRPLPRKGSTFSAFFKIFGGKQKF